MSEIKMYRFKIVDKNKKTTLEETDNFDSYKFLVEHAYEQGDLRVGIDYKNLSLDEYLQILRLNPEFKNLEAEDGLKDSLELHEYITALRVLCNVARLEEW